VLNGTKVSRQDHQFFSMALAISSPISFIAPAFLPPKVPNLPYLQTLNQLNLIQRHRQRTSRTHSIRGVEGDSRFTVATPKRHAGNEAAKPPLRRILLEH